MMRKEKINQKFCLIGEKISYSASPLIHNFIFSRDGIDASYEIIDVPRHEFTPESFRELAKKFTGINVTTPFKTIAKTFLGKNIDDAASKTGSVNSIHIRADGSIMGYNTDIKGLHSGILDIIAARTLFPSTLVLLGGGGAASSVIFTFLELHTLYSMNQIPEIIIALRKIEKNFDIVNLIAGLTRNGSRVRLQFIEFNESEIADAIRNGGLIINATPLGSINRQDQAPVKLENHAIAHGKRIIAVDLVYNPSKTEFLRSAESVGAQIINGLGMLVYQALESQEIWFGHRPRESGIFEMLADLNFEWLR
jgi:shikimate dehydrogenase